MPVIGSPDRFVIAPDLTPAQLAGVLLDRREFERRRARAATIAAISGGCLTATAALPLLCLARAASLWAALVTAAVAAAAAVVLAAVTRRSYLWTPPARLAAPLDPADAPLVAAATRVHPRTARTRHEQLWHLACLRACQRAVDAALDSPGGRNGHVGTRLLVTRADLADAVATVRARLRTAPVDPPARAVPVTLRPVTGPVVGHVVDALVEG